MASRYPHAEQVLDDWIPAVDDDDLSAVASALYSSMDRNSAHSVQEMARARDRLRTIPDTFRSSTAIRSAAWIRRVLVLCRKSRRASAIRACARATFTVALARFFEPRWQRASRRWCRISRRW